MKNHKKIPITLITGFLGSGKTTLLNNVIASGKTRKMAIIVNDFGDMIVDRHFVKTIDENVIELSDGCICCSIRTNFFNAVEGLVKLPNPPEHIIVECSGITDPGIVASTLMSPMLRNLITVDGIITVVDAKELLSSHNHSPALIEKQITQSNFVVLNKIDMVSEDVKNNVKYFITKLNSKVRILETVKASVPIELLLGFSNINVDFDELNFKGSGMIDTIQLYDSFSFRTKELFSKKALKEWLKNLPTEIIRGKGIVNVGTDNEVYSFNLVGSWHSFGQMKDMPDFNESEFVFIGNKGWLEQYNIKEDLLSNVIVN